MQKITPFLWFDHQAEEAANFYVGVFPNSKIGAISRYCDEAGGPAGRPPAGSVMTVEFNLAGQQFIALNGGPLFKFTPAISFVFHCDTQTEIDHLWTKLTAGGGAPSRCGWLTDKFGVSWQITPKILAELASSKDTAASQRMMRALMTMDKLDIAQLRQAFDHA
jgi:predicted 3-demethylubiquinone-9 3-methyltransferase (glyoxalase superfamily)